MSNFLAALRADLLDRRMRAIAVLLGAALIGALAYATLGGGGSTTPPAPAPAVSPGTGAPSRSIAPVATGSNPNHTLAETPNGSSKQRDGSTRNPFSPLPGSAPATAFSSASSKSSASSTGVKAPSGQSTQSAGGTSPAAVKTPTPTPAKPQSTYRVSIRLGAVVPGTPAQSAQLTPYENLKFQQKLPSPQLRLLAFNGVSSDGKKATFKLVGEVIPRVGPAVCSPSASQCQTIALEASQAEELEYLAPTGPAVVYELQLVGIAASQSQKH